MELSDVLLEIAKRDLRAAKILYEKELYPHAVFFLEQSVEKAAKSFAIMANMLRPEEIKNIGHNPLRIYEKLLNTLKEMVKMFKKVTEDMPELKDVSLIKEIKFSEVEQDIDKALQAIESLTPDSLIFLPKEKIQQIINDLNTLELQAKDMEKVIASLSISEEKLNQVKRCLSEILDILSKFNPPEAEKARKELSALSPTSLKQRLEKIVPLVTELYYYVFLSLIYLWIITYPHAVISRYPNGKFNPLQIYERDFPLVEYFKQLVEVMEKLLLEVEHLKPKFEHLKDILTGKLAIGE